MAARLSRGGSRVRARQAVLVGIFPAATAAYARAVAEALGPGVGVEGVTFEALAGDDATLRRAAAADLVLVMAHRRRDVAALLPRSRLATISFIPSEDTRRALATLDPRARVLAVSRFPDFLPLMRPGVGRFAPHVAGVEAALLDDPDLDARLARADVRGLRDRRRSRARPAAARPSPPSNIATARTPATSTASCGRCSSARPVRRHQEEVA